MGPTELYALRAVSDLGDWVVGPLTFKIYGLLAAGQTLGPDLRDLTHGFIADEVLERVADMGDSNDLGFVILHPGELGVTIAAQWWAQGSVLCQHIYRKAYDAADPMDTVTRPVVGCVWELELIQAEQSIWRRTMMGPEPDPVAYLAGRFDRSAA